MFLNHQTKALYSIAALATEPASGTHQRVLQISHILLPCLCDWMILDLPKATGSLQRHSLGLTGGVPLPVVQELTTFYSQHLDGERGAAPPCDPLEMESWEPEVSSAVLRPICASDEEVQLLLGMGLQSMMRSTFQVKDRGQGAITLFTSKDRPRFRRQDVLFIKEAAEKIAALLSRDMAIAELQKSVKDRENTLNFVSHELKNPLTAVIFGGDYLLNRFKRLTAEETIKTLEVIMKSAHRMNGFLGNLLEIGKLSSSGFQIRFDSVNLHALAAECLRSIQPQAQSKSIDVIAPQSEAPMLALGDAERIFQVLSNLLGNALKFTPSQGRVQVAIESSGGMLEVSVSDTGMGIAASDLPHIFKSFWQAKPAEKSGFGLGLNICKAIIEAHGGKIWATSRPGQGSRFAFTLRPWTPDAGTALRA